MHAYEEGVVTWANEQARLLRARRYDLLDIEHLAAVLEDVGKSEQRALASGMTVLLARLLTWQFQPERRSASTEKTVSAYRKQVRYVLDGAPSLMSKSDEPRWLDMIWTSAVAWAVGESGLDCFSDACPWAIETEVLAETWFPRSEQAENGRPQ